MNHPTTAQIREATKSVLHLIEATFGKDNEYYISLNSKQYRPRVELQKGVYYVSKLRASFMTKENHRAVAICDEYLALSKPKQECAQYDHNETIKQANEILCESAKYDPLNLTYKEYLKDDNVTHFL